MNPTSKRVAQAIVMTIALVIGGVMEAKAQTDVFTDTFDAAPTNGAVRILSPDNSAMGGTFGDSNDVFGIVDRNINGNFADDSVANGGDTTGIIPASKTDFFLGFEDTSNSDNPNADGVVSVIWTASIAGLTDLSLSFDIAVMGDFETADVLSFTASIDGSAEETLFTSVVDNDGAFTYTLDDGSMVELNDPLTIDGQIVSNVFQTFSFPISGTGSQLTLTLNYDTDAESEVHAIDNVSVTAAGGGVLKGDVDLSGTVDFADIGPFIAVLQGGMFQAEADCDCSTVVDFGDIPAFIAILQMQ